MKYLWRLNVSKMKKTVVQLILRSLNALLSTAAKSVLAVFISYYEQYFVQFVWV